MAGTRIQLNEAWLMQYYESMMDQIYMQYWGSLPTNIPHYNLTAAEIAEIAEYDAIGQGAKAINKIAHRNAAKVAKFDRDENWCNGLPRKR